MSVLTPQACSRAASGIKILLPWYKSSQQFFGFHVDKYL